LISTQFRVFKQLRKKKECIGFEKVNASKKEKAGAEAATLSDLQFV
jgi:hypothetical protein